MVVDICFPKFILTCVHIVLGKKWPTQYSQLAHVSCVYTQSSEEMCFLDAGGNSDIYKRPGGNHSAQLGDHRHLAPGIEPWTWWWKAGCVPTELTGETTTNGLYDFPLHYLRLSNQRV